MNYVIFFIVAFYLLYIIYVVFLLSYVFFFVFYVFYLNYASSFVLGRCSVQMPNVASQVICTVYMR